MLPARPTLEQLAAAESSMEDDEQRTDAAEAEAEDDTQAAADSKSPLPHSQYSILSAPHVGPVTCVRWSATGDYALSGGQDRGIHLWNPAKSKHIKAYTGAHGREVKDVQISPLNDRFASCGGDRTVFLWDVSTGDCVRRLRGHDSGVNSLSYNADASILASGGYDKTVRLWDAKAFSRDAIMSMGEAKDSVTGVLIRDTNLFTSSMDGCVRRYDIRKASKTTDHIAVPVSSIALSHDSNCLLLSCLDSTYRLLDVASGEMLNEYLGASAKDFRMEGCFEGGDGVVLGGSEQGHILAWDLVEAKVLARFLGHTGAVSSIAWNTKEKSFISAGVDGTIRFWR